MTVATPPIAVGGDVADIAAANITTIAATTVSRRDLKGPTVVSTTTTITITISTTTSSSAPPLQLHCICPTPASRIDCLTATPRRCSTTAAAKLRGRAVDRMKVVSAAEV